MVLHDPDHLWQRETRNTWNEEIKQYFGYYKDKKLLPKDNRYFIQGEEVVLGYPDDLKKQWLEAVRHAKVRKMRYENQFKQIGKSLTNWLIRRRR